VETKDESKCIVDSFGSKRWKNKEGACHRVGYPAVELYNGDKAWWFNGALHRLNGPAVEHAGGYKAWYIHGRKFESEKEYVEYKQFTLLKE